MNSLILKTYSKDECIRYVDGLEYLIPGWMIIRKQWIQNRKTYMIPGEDIWVSNRALYIYMWYQRPDDLMDIDLYSYNGNQVWFDRMILNITCSSDRPKCKNCGSELPFTKISHGGYGHSCYGQRNQFCCQSCRASYYNALGEIGFGLMASNPDLYPEMREWYEYGGGLKYYQDNKLDYVKSSDKLDRLTEVYENFLLRTLGESYGNSGIYKSKRFNRFYLYRSNLELRHIKKLEEDQNVLNFKYEPFGITYGEFETTYIPDLLVIYKDKSIKLVEIKPSRYVNDSINLEKFKAARAYCAERNWQFEVWTENDL